MRKLKKIIVSIVMALLLAVTAVPSTSIEVQAASVGKVTKLKSCPPGFAFSSNTIGFKPFLRLRLPQTNQPDRRQLLSYRIVLSS